MKDSHTENPSLPRPEPYPDITELARILRQVSVTELLPRFAKIQESKKPDGSLITEADITVQNEIQKRLGQLHPEILFLGEEMAQQDQQRILEQNDKAVWILDPLDGTTNFAAGIPYYAVSLALLYRGNVVLGLVYDPERDECFTAEEGRGAKLSRKRDASFYSERLSLQQDATSSPSELVDSVACIDLKRLPQKLAAAIVEHHPFRSQRSFGGVALDWCWLAAGRFDIYLHGKQNIWDYAAGNLVFSEAGGYSSTLESEPVFINALSPRVGIGAGNQEIFQKWLSWLNQWQF